MLTVRRSPDGLPTSAGRMFNERCTRVQRTPEMEFCMVAIISGCNEEALTRRRAALRSRFFLRQNDKSVKTSCKTKQPE